MKTKRLEYIDILRSVAILMMLEGHFMTHSLLPVFRDPLNPIYAVWKFTRGLTAPLFLSVSGLIFTYLLLQSSTQGWSNPRVQKGLKRGITLIAIGYFLQFNLYTHFFSERPLFTSLTQIFHVLQCIGTSLILLITIYLIKTYILKIPLGFLLGIMGLLVVIISPTLYAMEYTYLPRFIENILITSKDTTLKTSVFPLFPWSGYVFLGGALGSVIYTLKHKANHFLFPFGLIVSGVLVQLLTYPLLAGIQKLPLFNLLKSFKYGYEPVRFCQVLIFIGLIILLQKGITTLRTQTLFDVPKIVVRNLIGISFGLGCYLFTTPLETPLQNIVAYSLFFIPIVLGMWKLSNWNYQTFIKIGQNTLSVYVLHVILLYQGFFGFRLDILIKNKLTPFFSISGAILFIFFFLAYTQYEPVLIQILHRIKVRYKIIKRKVQYRTSTI
ncbi:putative membrane protein [Wenyingzhuangia heitensis]|uniref:Membrane protein n=1 Tax=Wenyingzhuangia heitensis TaxID=1487859 RepID=A0ABX0U8T8_9FLAO|nr:heparan-alpha-glucosaminide N-acetyltransferase domain-containing protein [Wenyingzhuangia heitensis]NIJ45237.1 putative membrane protein [Wenyingzhuangia heitensis]